MIRPSSSLPDAPARNLDFRHSFVIRHSSFVILVWLARPRQLRSPRLNPAIKNKALAVAIFLCFFTLASPRADWTLQSSTRIETASPAITLVRKTVTGDRDVEIHIVFFDIRKCDLRVIDQPGESGDLEAAMLANKCLAGVNGNYFHPDHTSLGLVISDGVGVHALERAKLLSGLLVSRPGHFSLLRFAEFTPEKSITQALQAGPFFIDKGGPVPGLEATRVADRTVILSDGKNLGAFLVCRSATLAETAAILATPGIITEMHITRALNLDGGSSAGLWVDALPKPLYISELKSVRNYLALMPRSR